MSAGWAWAVMAASMMVLAGCLDADPKGDASRKPKTPVVIAPSLPAAAATPKLAELVFRPVQIIDRDHAGGEPVILVDKKGTIIVSSHPGWTHLRGVDTDLVTSANGQIYVWRSETGGETWQFVGLPVAPVGPRNAAISVSDPDIAMSPDGTIFLTSLNSLVAIPVEISKDNGKTWSGQPLHGPAGVDRNWIEACNDRDIYQVYSSFGTLGAGLVPGQPLGSGGRWFAHSTDGGLTWTDQHAVGVGGNFACDQKTEGGKYLYLGCGPTLSVSTDKGKTWRTTRAAGFTGGGSGTSCGLSEPAVDSAGNVFTTWISNGTREPKIYYAVSQDHGASFSRVVEVPTTGLFNGTQLWPWITAKDEGHIAIVWYATSQLGAPSAFGPTVTWHVFSAIIPNALESEPIAYIAQASDVPIHKGPICTSGTACQANPQPNGDRRLGDFFTATFDHDGALLIASASTQGVTGTTQFDGGGLAHPVFIKQIGGPGGLAAKPVLVPPATR